MHQSWKAIKEHIQRHHSLSLIRESLVGDKKILGGNNPKPIPITEPLLVPSIIQNLNKKVTGFTRTLELQYSPTAQWDYRVEETSSMLHGVLSTALFILSPAKKFYGCILVMIWALSTLRRAGKKYFRWESSLAERGWAPIAVWQTHDYWLTVLIHATWLADWLKQLLSQSLVYP